MPSRTVTDPQGRRWLVWAVHPSVSGFRLTPAGVHPDFVAGWLAFETPDAKRRLAPIPTDWESASEAELLDFLGRATEARRRTPARDALIASD